MLAVQPFDDRITVRALQSGVCGKLCKRCQKARLSQLKGFNRVRQRVLAGHIQERKLRVGTWNFSGLCSEHKQKEVGELLQVNKIDIVAGQESWEKEDSKINVDGYKWFEKPRVVQSSQRGEFGVGFFVRDCLVNEVEFISEVKYAESV